jgi:hypothetical protein
VEYFERLLGGEGAAFVVAEGEEEVPDEEEGDALVAEGIADVLVGVDEVAVVLPPLQL